MTTRERYFLATVIVIVPWALVVLGLAVETPSGLVLAVSPATFLALALNQESVGANIAIVIGGTLVLIVLLASIARRVPGALLPIGFGFFFLACWFAAQMRV